MMHIATIHWQTDRWIELQLAAFERCVAEPYRVYAFLNDVPGDHASQFFYASQEPIADHAAKLNLLAAMACFNAASDDDILLFIDGDAFPIAPLQPFVCQKLADHCLIAVQRYENNGDLQPHPCFCVTTVGFWRAIGGDWHYGGTWLDLDGNEISDVGGNLLTLLEAAGVDWYRLRRVNRLNPDPLFFGVYGDESGPLVYHHGAGFRPGLSRIGVLVGGGREAHTTPRARILESLPGRRFGRLRHRLHPARRVERDVAARSARLGEEWFGRFLRDAEAWRELL
jgi:hypothetical protein